MFTIPGLAALVTLIYVRPQEFLPALQRFPLLYLCFGLAIFGLVLDVRLGHLRLTATPQLPLVLALWFWMVVTVAIGAPAALQTAAVELSILVALYLVITQGLQSFRGLKLCTGLMVAIGLYLAAVGVHQGLQPYGCAVIDTSDPRDLSRGIPDGRPCENELTCRGPGAEPGGQYMCERIGWFGTTSIGDGRVRYLGVLQDPNELSIAIGAALAFAFAFATQRKTLRRRLLLVITLLLVATCTVMTKSRGGQLVFLAVLGTFFLRRVGFRGLVFAALLALPILVLGGRSGSEADESAQLRLETWREGLRMFVAHPLLGVGQGQFPEHHEYTAHNAYLLVAAELGLPGMILWTCLVYLSAKIPIAAMRRYARWPGAEVARHWATALTAAVVGILVGIFFLSMSYHYVLWIYLALCGAFHAAVRRHDPGFRVRLAVRDIVWVVALDLGLLMFLDLYLRLKGV